ncbi:CaiB/BaiF CoA transferase family protein, partial [Chloroflexota bacterium]
HSVSKASWAALPFFFGLAEINPRIIYAQATGFGIKGPHKDRMAFDNTSFWIRSGIMSTLGEPDAPPVPLRGGMGDLTTAVFLAGATITALFARDRFGFGQKVDISLMSSGMWVGGSDIQLRLALEEREENRKYSRKDATNPLRNTYQTKDKKWLYLHMVQTDRWWPAFCSAIEREDLEEDPRFDSHKKRVEHSKLIVSILDEVLATKTLAEWADRFEQYGLIWEPETRVSEVLADPQVSENNYVAMVENPSGNLIKLPSVPFQFNKTPIGPRRPAPQLGQHTEEVLLELGYDWGQISELKEQKVIT